MVRRRAARGATTLLRTATFTGRCWRDWSLTPGHFLGGAGSTWVVAVALRRKGCCRRCRCCLAGRGRLGAHAGAGGAQADARGGSAASCGGRGVALCRGLVCVVVSNFSWHWFQPAAGDEVLRVLQPGGWLLVSAPLRHFSSAEGNRWLARKLHARRRNFRRLGSQGLRIEELANLLPGEMRTHRLESVVIEERFPDASALLATLESRGSLHAIFGGDGLRASGQWPTGSLAFEWHVGLLQAQVRP